MAALIVDLLLLSIGVGIAVFGSWITDKYQGPIYAMGVLIYVIGFLFALFEAFRLFKRIGNLIRGIRLSRRDPDEAARILREIDDAGSNPGTDKDE